MHCLISDMSFLLIGIALPRPRAPQRRDRAAPHCVSRSAASLAHRHVRRGPGGGSRQWHSAVSTVSAAREAVLRSGRAVRVTFTALPSAVTPP